MFLNQRADQLAAAVMMIGMGLLFTNWLPIPFWPGILFVIGAAALVRGLADRSSRFNVYALYGGFWMIGMGIIFLFDLGWPVWMILIGVSALIGYGTKDRWYRDGDTEKAKNADQSQSPQ
jgi:hypothetical protein